MSAMEIGIERQSSIEKEPLTLNIDQIQFARASLSLSLSLSIYIYIYTHTHTHRSVSVDVFLGWIWLLQEAALYVMNNRSIEEALRIFTKGLKPVVNSVGNESDELMNSGEELETSTNELRILEIRDIVSAPF
ncbi:Hypothetical predicted protein [Olea europaea subsp. europaea]|uniref:Uncharacterized protein n=1 Tax=Olea europaea subsp. europaea TaxID=158383 RepID=A0A8S0V8R1_OLEEU|nr:Hypothetical predicted protein [Olea europaea subsp. europaea]